MEILIHQTNFNNRNQHTETLERDHSWQDRSRPMSKMQRSCNTEGPKNLQQPTRALQMVSKTKQTTNGHKNRQIYQAAVDMAKNCDTTATHYDEGTRMRQRKMWPHLSILWEAQTERSRGLTTVISYEYIE